MKKFGERDLAVIEMREIDAGIEDAPAGVFRMLHDAAAQHADFDRVVEQHEIDRGFQRGGGEIVLGVEEFGVGQGDVADLAFALDLGLAEVGKPAAAEFGEPLQRLALRLEHRVDEMHAAWLVGEDLREEQALIELAAFLGALLHQRPFRVDLRAASAAAPDSGWRRPRATRKRARQRAP